MQIHVVQPGETLFSISEQYGVPLSRLTAANGISYPDRLVAGQTVILTYPKQVHIVTPGDTLFSISNQYGISIWNLLRNNPGLTDSEYLYAGQEIVISYDQEKRGTLTINGYAYPFIDRQILRSVLPYLTYLSIFSYGFTIEGNLVETDDEELLRQAALFQTAPVMVLTPTGTDGRFNNVLLSRMLNDTVVRDNLIENILNTLREKSYYGLDIDFEYILPEDKQAYLSFVERCAERLSRENGFPVSVALPPKTAADQKGLLYEAADYYNIGRLADHVLLMTYEWGYTLSGSG